MQFYQTGAYINTCTFFIKLLYVRPVGLRIGENQFVNIYPITTHSGLTKKDTEKRAVIVHVILVSAKYRVRQIYFYRYY